MRIGLELLSKSPSPSAARKSWLPRPKGKILLNCHRMLSSSALTISKNTVGTPIRALSIRDHKSTTAIAELTAGYYPKSINRRYAIPADRATPAVIAVQLKPSPTRIGEFVNAGAISTPRPIQFPMPIGFPSARNASMHMYGHRAHDLPLTCNMIETHSALFLRAAGELRPVSRSGRFGKRTGTGWPEFNGPGSV